MCRERGETGYGEKGGEGEARDIEAQRLDANRGRLSKVWTGRSVCCSRLWLRTSMRRASDTKEVSLDPGPDSVQSIEQGAVRSENHICIFSARYRDLDLCPARHDALRAACGTSHAALRHPVESHTLRNPSTSSLYEDQDEKPITPL